MVLLLQALPIEPLHSQLPHPVLLSSSSIAIW
ncbi:unnamed protein product [Gongylonema pulchrum]|uniref:Uncharacterized protein n=1 Tax=Gongylonema pulchrum TaxID=637853 RepID=A0A183CZL4_9BILA|nr:unnamed protein product [Gongylonema pulchrum]